ncbi:MAG: hypothetical protein RML56_11665 [Burkholderiales bacterium]|nr:hypothetical protein [Burkholderiales bacterium]
MPPYTRGREPRTSRTIRSDRCSAAQAACALCGCARKLPRRGGRPTTAAGGCTCARTPTGAPRGARAQTRGEQRGADAGARRAFSQALRRAPSRSPRSRSTLWAGEVLAVVGESGLGKEHPAAPALAGRHGARMPGTVEFADAPRGLAA